jgi:hypothetical protein
MIATFLEEAVRPCKRPIELSAVDLNQKGDAPDCRIGTQQERGIVKPTALQS